jgi:hypothetical protein
MVVFQCSKQDKVNKNIVFNNKGEKGNYLSYLVLLELYNTLVLVFEAAGTILVFKRILSKYEKNK